MGRAQNDTPLFYLANASDEIICCLNSVDIANVSYTEKLMSFDELSFTVSKYIDIDGVRTLAHGYDQLDEMNYIIATNLDRAIVADPATDVSKSRSRFRIESCTIEDDGYTEIKTISCYSAEVELNNQSLVAFKVNTGDVDSLEYLYEDNVDEATGLAKDYITVYNPTNPHLSLLDLAIEQIPYWSVGYVDPLIRNKKFSFDVDSTTIYAFLSELSQTAQIIFTFDTLNRKINAYSIERLDEIGETNITVSYRNLLNSITIEKSGDGICTRFNVSGNDNLSIAAVNFGDDHLENLLHILQETDSEGRLIHSSESLNAKYSAWYEYRYGNNTNRADYMALVQRYNQLTLDIDEIQTKVPSDVYYTDQYTDMSVDDLGELLKTYTQAANILASPYAQRDSTGNLVLSNSGLAIIAKQSEFEESDGWFDYQMYVDVVIPNLETAIANRNLPTDDKADYDQTWQTNWELYGTIELQNKIAAYNLQLSVLEESGYKKEWNQLTDEEKSRYSQSVYEDYHAKYVDTERLISSAQTALQQKQEQLDAMVEERNAVQENRLRLASLAKIENEQFGLTEEELHTVYRLRKDSDYVNNNIVTTTLDSIVSEIDIMNELFAAAQDELDVESQHQYSFSIDLDNLFNIPEFAQWTSAFTVGKFIRVMLNDSEQVKLRILQITRNPCDDTSQSISVEFSNMIRGRNGLSDYTDLFDSAINSRINQITSNYARKLDLSNVVLSESILKAIANSGTMQSAVGNIVTNQIVAKDGVFDTLSSQYISTDEFESRIARITQLSSDSAFIKYLESTLIVSGEVDADKLKATLAQISVADIGSVFADSVTSMVNTSITTTVDDAFIQSAIVNKIYVDQLLGGTINTNKFKITSSEDGNNEGIVIEGATQYWYDENGVLRMQAGQDSNGDFTFALFDETGNGTLIDSTGVKDGALADDIVTERMMSNNSVSTDTIQNAAITSGKIDWASFSEYVNEQGSNVIDISEFTVGENGLEYKLGEFITRTDTDLKNSVKKITPYYALGSSDTTPPPLTGDGEVVYYQSLIGIAKVGMSLIGDNVGSISNWSTTQPTAQDGSYLWQRFLVEHTDGTATWTTPTLITDELVREQITTIGTEFAITKGQIESRIWQTDIDSAISPLTGEVTTISNQYSTLTQTVNGLEAKVTSVSQKTADDIDDISSKVAEIELATDGLTTTVSNVQQNLTNNYSTTKTVQSMISQLSDSISLSVTGGLGNSANISLSVNGKTQDKLLDLSNVRKAFADDPSVVAIGAGTIRFNAGTLQIDTSNMTLDENGNVAIVGNITAMSGYIGSAQSGWSISESKIYGGNSATGVAVMQMPNSNDGYVFAAGGTSHSDYSTCPFRVTSAGALYATNATISGDITATGGHIGGENGWVIDAGIIYGGSVQSGYTILRTPTQSDTEVISVGGNSIAGDSTSQFVVYANGSVNATSATISGTITATSGYIGTSENGWTIERNRIIGGNLLTGDRIAIIQTPTSVNSLVFAAGGVTSDGITSYPFSVNASGKLIASNAELTGKITATSGYIGSENSGWRITSSKIYGGDPQANNDERVAVMQRPGGSDGNATTVFAAGGRDHSNYSDCPFRVTKDGKLYATDASITGDVTATAFRLQSEGRTLNFALTAGDYIVSSSGTTNYGTTFALRSASMLIDQGRYLMVNVPYKFAGMNMDLPVQLIGLTNTGNISIGSAEYAYAELTNGTVSGKTMIHGDEIHFLFGESDPNNIRHILCDASGTIRPNSNGGCQLGTSASRWGQIYTTTSVSTSSDRKRKDHISYLRDEEGLEDFMMSLRPVSFTLKDGTGGRKHMGFYSQDVQESANRSMGDLAVYTADVISDGEIGYYSKDVSDENLIWSLRYDEFVAPIVAMLQKQQEEIKELKRIIMEYEN